MRTSGEIKRAVEEEEEEEEEENEVCPSSSRKCETVQINVTRSNSLNVSLESDTAVIDCTDVTPMLTKISSSKYTNIVNSNTPRTLNIVSKDDSDLKVPKISQVVPKSINKSEKSVSFLDTEMKTSLKSIIPFTTDDIIRYTNRINILNNINSANKKSITHPVSILKQPSQFVTKADTDTLNGKIGSSQIITLSDSSAQTDISYINKNKQTNTSATLSNSKNSVSLVSSPKYQNLRTSTISTYSGNTDDQNFTSNHNNDQSQSSKYNTGIQCNGQNNSNFMKPSQPYLENCGQSNQNYIKNYTQASQNYTQTSQNFTQTNKNYSQLNYNYSQNIANYSQPIQNYPQISQNYTQTCQTYTQTSQNYTQTGQNFTQTYENYSSTNQNYLQTNEMYPNFNHVNSYSNDNVFLTNCPDSAKAQTNLQAVKNQNSHQNHSNSTLLINSETSENKPNEEIVYCKKCSETLLGPENCKTTLDKSKSYENKKLTDGKILNKLYNFGSCNSQSIVKDKFNDCGGRLIFNHKCENCFYI